MRWLLRLYPRDWRRRYGAEMEAFLAEARPGPRDVLDLLRGALDARLHPQCRPARARRRARRRVTYGPPRRARGWAGHRSGVRLMAAFAGLLALRYLADRVVLPAGQARLAALAPAVPGPTAVRLVLLHAALAALWGGLAVVLLRRTRLPAPVAFAAGCALDLALGSTLLFLPGSLEPLRMALWAATMTALTRLRRRRPGRDDDPPEGAPVAARPLPDPPEPLSAVSGGTWRRRAG
jgi:hypothetical protein